MEHFIFKGHKEAELPAVIWMPEGEPRGVLHEACSEQVCHCIADWLEGKH